MLIKYLKFLKRFLSGKITLNFKSPKYIPIVLFDGESLNHLKYLLTNYEYNILEVRPNRINEIFISVKFITKFFLNIFIISNKSGKNLITIYSYTVLKMIKPKIVITSIDNHGQFSDLARLLDDEIQFLAVQNANRHDFAINLFKYENRTAKKNINNDFYLPHYFCFGQLEIDDCNLYKINVKNFYKYGSIGVANFFHYLNQNKIKLNKNKYDICLISEPAVGQNADYNQNSIEEGFAQIARFAIKFSRKHKLKFIFATKRIKKTDLVKAPYHSEINYYKKYLDKSDFDYLMNNFNEKKDFSSSFQAIFESKVAVGVQSTLLRNKIGHNEKILSCNLTNFKIYDFPINGVCTINNCNYEDLENRLQKILNMSIKDYFSNIDRDKSYIMTFDKELSTIDKIKKKIDIFLKS